MNFARLDLPRIGIATVVAAGLGVGLAVSFLRHAQSTRDVGPTSATLDDAYSSLLGAAIGLALGGLLGAFSVRRGSRFSRACLVELYAYVFVPVPVFCFPFSVCLLPLIEPGAARAVRLAVWIRRTRATRLAATPISPIK